MAKHNYPETSNNIDMNSMEIAVQKYWKEEDIFKKSLVGSEEFLLYDGPPFANGLPHCGHLLTGYLKDAYARFQTMQGKRVDRTFGWDCHGLPAEMSAEKELGISGRRQISEFGIDKFNDQCKTSILKYTNQWREYVNRQGRWVDFENGYKTMDISFMESVLWAFKKLYQKGLIYQSSQVLPYSWKCETPVSNFETRMDNCYREKLSKTVTVALQLTSTPESIRALVDSCEVHIWTTTPWTMPSNQALAIGRDITYEAFIPEGSKKAIIASSSYLDEHYKDGKKVNLQYTELLGKKYIPAFDYFKSQKNSFEILIAEFVKADEGTGIVHMAPGFGEDDYRLCTKHGIEVVCPVDNSGAFTSDIKDFVGINVLESNDGIIIAMKKSGNWVRTGQHRHSYPHCWRTDSPLIYRAIDSWYINVEKIKERMVELNREVNWVPEHIKTGQFGKWLEGAKDWAISRNRFWGTPIPIWKSDNPDYPRTDVYGSIDELERDFGVKITDLHRPFIDQLQRSNPDDPSGKSQMVRVSEVLDCWFESGSMPYGQFHYPFENKGWFEKCFPADFITEYVSQTRGWFYTLFVLSTALFDSPPFKNCVCHGVVLDLNKQKLSKRLNNYQDPLVLMKQYGSDSLRFLMLSSPVCTGGSLLIDKDGNMARDVMRLVIRPLWSAYHFFCMNANADEIQAIRINNQSPSLTDLDSYILNKMDESMHKIVYHMQEYDSVSACNKIEDFLDILNNWYIRRSRPRFWRSEHDIDKFTAYNTLYTVLTELCIMAAPFLPMLVEHVWSGLITSGSVHLQKHRITAPYDAELIEGMDLIKLICSTGSAIRNRHGIRSRQVLPKVTLLTHDRGILEKIEKYSYLIKEELNVKSVKLSSSLTEDVEVQLKPNFKQLALKAPGMIPKVKEALEKKQYRLDRNGTIEMRDIGISLKETEYTKTVAMRENKYSDQVGNFSLLAILDVAITPELELEGRMRDIIRFIQQSRKEMSLHISKKIFTTIHTEDPSDVKAIKMFATEIKEQTLSKDILIRPSKHGEVPMFSFGNTGISISAIDKL